MSIQLRKLQDLHGAKLFWRWERDLEFSPLGKKLVLKGKKNEPTSALDPEMIGEVLDVMVKLASKGMTMCVVTHEVGFARQVAHRVIFMDEGSLVETGSPHDFFDNPQMDRAAQFISKILTQ